MGLSGTDDASFMSVSAMMAGVNRCEFGGVLTPAMEVRNEVACARGSSFQPFV